MIPRNSSEQLMFSFPEPLLSKHEAAPQCEVTRLARLAARLGETTLAEALFEKPYYELGGGIAEAVADQEHDRLEPFRPFIEAYAANKLEIKEIFERYQFPDLTIEMLDELGGRDSAALGILGTHIVYHVEHMQVRGGVLALEGAFDGNVAKPYQFTDEPDCIAYGQELIELAKIIRSQPTFTKLSQASQAFLTGWLREQPRYSPRTGTPTQETRRKFVAAHSRRNTLPKVALERSRIGARIELTYPDKTIAS